MGSSRAIVPAALVAAALLIGACGGSGDTTAQTLPEITGLTTTRPTTTTRPATTTTTGQASADEAALRKLANEWAAASRRLVMAPNPNDESIDRLLSGEMRRKAVSDIEVRLRRKQVGQAANPSNYRHSVLDISVRDEAAAIHECVVDDDLLVSSTTGEVEDASVATYETRTIAARVGSTWKLVRRSSDFKEGITGCALAE